MKMGSRMFATCSICHGSDAKGALGFPNLADNEWRWGGDPQSIETTILGGRHARLGRHPRRRRGEERRRRPHRTRRAEAAGRHQGRRRGRQADLLGQLRRLATARKRVPPWSARRTRPTPARSSTAPATPSSNKPSAMAARARCRPRSPTWARKRCTSWPPTYNLSHNQGSCPTPPPGRGSFPVSDLSPRRRDEVSHQRTPFLPFLFNRVCFCIRPSGRATDTTSPAEPTRPDSARKPYGRLGKRSEAGKLASPPGARCNAHPLSPYLPPIFVPKKSINRGTPSMSISQTAYNYKVVRQFAVMTVVWGSLEWVSVS